jgi:hypothetical protein
MSKDEKSDRLVLSDRDSLRVIAFLESPPEANAKLRTAAKDLPLMPLATIERLLKGETSPWPSVPSDSGRLRPAPC